MTLQTHTHNMPDRHTLSQTHTKHPSQAHTHHPKHIHNTAHTHTHKFPKHTEHQPVTHSSPDTHTQQHTHTYIKSQTYTYTYTHTLHDHKRSRNLVSFIQAPTCTTSQHPVACTHTDAPTHSDKPSHLPSHAYSHSYSYIYPHTHSHTFPDTSPKSPYNSPSLPFVLLLWSPETQPPPYLFPTIPDPKIPLVQLEHEGASLLILTLCPRAQRPSVGTWACANLGSQSQKKTQGCQALCLTLCWTSWSSLCCQGSP
jgi:hypothetical protein